MFFHLSIYSPTINQRVSFKIQYL